MEKKFVRIIDANFNRSREALRVCEDLARFLLDDQGLTAKFKKCRHQLASILLKFPVPYRKMVAARNSATDVGKKSWIQDGSRPKAKDLMVANLKRCQESTRVLEEMAKALSPAQVSAFQKMRFEIYELEKLCFRKF